MLPNGTNLLFQRFLNSPLSNMRGDRASAVLVKAPVFGDASVSNAPDRSHLADAIHLMDLIHLVDEEVPAVRATVDRSKAAVVTAQTELDKHQRWLEGHQELYVEAVKACQRRLKRQAFISACKQRALLPIQLLASACVALSHAAWAYPRRLRLRAKLQNRIQALDQPRALLGARQGGDPDIAALHSSSPLENRY